MFQTTTGDLDSPSSAERVAPSGRRLFRIVLALTLVFTTIQGAIGGPLAGEVGGGFQIASSASFSAVLSAIMGSSGLLIFHAFEGLAIFLLAVSLAAISFRSEARGVKIFGVLSLIAALVALVGGYLHIGGNPAGIPLMSEGFIATYAFLFVTLYFSK